MDQEMYWLISWRPEYSRDTSICWCEVLGTVMQTGGCDGLSVERLIDLVETSK